MLTTFKIIKWLLKAFFFIVKSLILSAFGLDNEEKNKKVKFNGKVVTDKSFQVLNRKFAKDLTTAYYKDRAFSYADVPTFEALDEYYAKDKDRAYFCDEYREGQNYYLTKKQTILTIGNADTPTFTSLENGYAKDSTQAWFRGIAFQVEQVSSLVSINTYFSKDDVSAY
jgi:hypothetical protein